MVTTNGLGQRSCGRVPLALSFRCDMKLRSFSPYRTTFQVPRKKTQQNLSFSIPIRLALPAPCISRPPCPFPDSDSCFDISSPFSSRPTTPPESNIHHFNVNPSNSSKAAALTATPVLPPYSQFYYSNGDRKIDPTPLPLYTPRGVSPSEHLSSSESSDDEDGDSNPVVLPPVLPYSQKFCEVWTCGPNLIRVYPIVISLSFLVSSNIY